LPEIDAALAGAGEDPAWLHRKVAASPFSDRTPIEHMVSHGTAGLTDVLRFLNRLAMRAALLPAQRRTRRGANDRK
jgi:Protein of unknown function (DUF2384)